MEFEVMFDAAPNYELKARPKADGNRLRSDVWKAVFEGAGSNKAAAEKGRSNFSIKIHPNGDSNRYPIRGFPSILIAKSIYHLQLNRQLFASYGQAKLFSSLEDNIGADGLAANAGAKQQLNSVAEWIRHEMLATESIRALDWDRPGRTRRG